MLASVEVIRLVYSDWVKRKLDEVLSWQNDKSGDDDDGGFRAERIRDQGGVWTTAETLHTLIKYKILPTTDTRVQRAKAWLIRHRNLGGDYGDGWPLINRGNSFVDTTCMAIQALLFFPDDPEAVDAVKKAKDWLFANQNDDGGWGIWKYEDSLVSATCFAVLALKEVTVVYPDENTHFAIQAGLNWLKMIQDPNSRLWGFCAGSQESNNASTCQAVSTLFQFGEDPKNYREALSSLLAEFKENGYWKTIEESYTLKYFGEGLDNRLSWFLAPLAVTVLIEYSESMPKEIGITQIVEAVESLKKFDTVYKSREVTRIDTDHDVRVWASVELLKGLLEAKAYLEEHLDEYVSVMSGKLTIIEKAGMLKSLPIMFTLSRKTSIYASGRFLVALVPLIGLSLLGATYFTATKTIELEHMLIIILFSIYMLTFAILLIGYKQNVVSRSRFAYLYFPIWALIVLSTGLFIFEHAAEGVIVLLLIGFPEILHHLMGKSHKE
jgi:prenyltransferase beta subunit